jgi:lantibiotic transport system permease protein
MAAILITSLVTQIEYRNNAWKQVRTLPIPALTLFFAKLALIAVLMVEFFVLFDLGVYLSAILPSVLIPGVPYPTQPLPFWPFLADTGVYMTASLPIVALQYLLSLQFKNFLVPVGVGFMTWVAALAALSSSFSWLIPYAYTMLHYLKDDAKGRAQLPTSQLQWMSLGYTLLFLAVGYILFANQKQQG